MKIEDCTTPEQVEEILIDKDFIVNDEIFKKLPIGTLKILKLFLLKGYTLNENSYNVIMSDVFCDDEYYQTASYLHEKNYIIPEKMIKDAELSKKNL